MRWVSYVKPSFDAKDWRELDLPHDWVVELPFNPRVNTSHGKKDIDSRNRDRAGRAMEYFLAKLPSFPEGTFASINLGFSPDCLSGRHGGNGRPYLSLSWHPHQW